MYDRRNPPLDIPLIVNCDDSSVVKHGLDSDLMVDRVRESKVALEALRKELMSAASGTRSVRQENWNKSPHLVRWFGEFSEHGTIQLYSRCTRILTALGNPLYTVKCAEKLGKLAGRGDGSALLVVIYAAVVGQQVHQEQLATVIHEVGHAVVAGADFRYYQEGCLRLVKKHPAIARVNLDNLAYCAVECIGYKWSEALNGWLPAPRKP